MRARSSIVIGLAVLGLISISPWAVRAGAQRLAATLTDVANFPPLGGTGFIEVSRGSDLGVICFVFTVSLPDGLPPPGSSNLESSQFDLGLAGPGLVGTVQLAHFVQQPVTTGCASVGGPAVTDMFTNPGSYRVSFTEILWDPCGTPENPTDPCKVGGLLAGQLAFASDTAANPSLSPTATQPAPPAVGQLPSTAMAEHIRGGSWLVLVALASASSCAVLLARRRRSLAARSTAYARVGSPVAGRRDE